MVVFINRWGQAIIFSGIIIFAYILSYILITYPDSKLKDSTDILLSIIYGDILLTTVCSSILLIFLSIFIAQFLFPRIVITIGPNKIIKHDINQQVVIYAGGKKVYDGKNIRNSFPVQFSFLVWQRGKYDICLEVRENDQIPKALIKNANTFESSVCHVVFGEVAEDFIHLETPN